MADENTPAFYPRVGNITPKRRAPLAQTEVREQPLDPIMRKFKELMDRSSELLDKSKITPYDLAKGLIGAIPFEGERFAKDFSQSTMPVPTGFGLLPKATPQGLDTSEMGMQSVRVPTKEALNELKFSDLVGTAGASRMFEALGQNRTPEFFDTLDAATLGLGGLSLARAAPKVAKAVGEGAKTVGRGAEQAGRAIERGMEPIVRGALERGGLPREMALAMGANTQSNVVKPKGGNWVLDPRMGRMKSAYDPVEALADIQKLRSQHGDLPMYATDEIEIKNRIATDKWVDSNLKNYIKNEMGTVDDPIRLLIEKRETEILGKFEKDQERAQRMASRAEAEPDPRRKANMTRQANLMFEQAGADKALALQHKSHLPPDLQTPESMWTPEDLARTRKLEGFPEEEIGKTKASQIWEQMADESIYPTKAFEIQQYPAKMQKRSEAYAKLVDFEAKVDQKLRDKFLTAGVDESVLNKYLQNTLITEKADVVGEGAKGRKLFNSVGPLPSNQQFLEQANTQNPWLAKVDPNSSVYSGEISGLNFDHIVDVIKEDLATGRLRPEKLNTLSIEQAVRRTADYDLELAKKMNADRASARANLPVYKEYPEGLKWVELNRPGDFAAESDAMGHSVRGYEPPKGHPDWTEGSGDSGSSSYGLGGWEAIKSGRAKVYSLVDAKGEPHATIEVNKGRHPLGTTGRGNNFPDELHYGEYNNSYAEIPKEKQQEIYELGKKLYFENPNAYAENRILSGDRTPDIMDSFQKAADMLLGERPGYVRQIKGKGNARPIDKYDPYTQDFVKSGGWADVNDLQNTGLINVDNKYFTEPELTEAVKKYGRMGVQDTPWEVARQRHIEAGVPEDEALRNWVEAFKEGRGRLEMPPEVPPNLEGMKRGGKVNISNNPDTMMLELNNQKMAGGGAIAKLARAASKSKAEIDAIARRMAPQMLGEFVRGDSGTQSVAGKTQKQFAKEKEMVHDIRPTGAERPLPKTVDVEDLKDQVMIGISGDPTISGQTLHGLNGVPLDSPSPQHGGPLYGLGRDEEFWASGLGAANRVQNLAREAGKQYDMPVLGKYIMMGPESINYAQHYADANLSAINPAKMSKGQIESFNNLVREGYPYTKNKERFQKVFPAFPGIENPSEAYLHFSIDPELRKHFNALMQMPTVTEKHGMPSGVDVRHAITEPDLRDLETGVTGKSIGRMRPEVTQLGLSEHPTYSHDIPGEFMGSSKYPIPYELSFPDTVKAIRENPKQAPHEFGSLKMIGPRQVIDQQMIDEIKQYQEMIKKYTGKKKGGAVHKAAGGEVTGDDLILEERPL